MTGLSALLVKGGLALAAIAYLTTRDASLARIAGTLLAIAVTGFCAFVVFVLIADNVGKGSLAANLRPGGSLAVLVFTSVFASTAVVAYSNLKRRHPARRV